MTLTFDGCGTSKEWHVNYVAGHNASSCHRQMIRKTSLGLRWTCLSCLLVQSLELTDKILI